MGLIPEAQPGARASRFLGRSWLTMSESRLSPRDVNQPLTAAPLLEVIARNGPEMLIAAAFLLNSAGNFVTAMNDFFSSS